MFDIILSAISVFLSFILFVLFLVQLILYKKKKDEITPDDNARLIKWLKAHGHSSDEILECIEYISDSEE